MKVQSQNVKEGATVKAFYITKDMHGRQLVNQKIMIQINDSEPVSFESIKKTVESLKNG